MVKSPEEPIGSPSSTASCAPGASTGGTGPYFIWSGLKAFCGGAGAGAAARMVAHNINPRNIVFMTSPPRDGGIIALGATHHRVLGWSDFGTPAIEKRGRGRLACGPR